MSDTTGGELVPVPEPKPQQFPLSLSESRPIVTNIPQDLEHLDLWTAVNNPADREGKQVIGQELEVKWFYAHIVDRERADTGEIVPTPRLVLFGPDRRSVVASGAAVRDAFATIVRVLGNRVYDPPLKIRLESVKGGNGFAYHVLRLIAAPVSPKPKGK